MNIWKLTFTTTEKRQLVAIVIALTPKDARTLVSKNPSFEKIVDHGTCSQLGQAASNLRQAEIVLMSLV